MCWRRDRQAVTNNTGFNQMSRFLLPEKSPAEMEKSPGRGVKVSPGRVIEVEMQPSSGEMQSTVSTTNWNWQPGLRKSKWVGDCCCGGGLLLFNCSIVIFFLLVNPASLNVILRIYTILNPLFTSRVVSLGHLPKGLTFQSLGCAYCLFELVTVVGSATCAPTVLRQDVDRLIKLSTYAMTSSRSRE